VKKSITVVATAVAAAAIMFVTGYAAAQGIAINKDNTLQGTGSVGSPLGVNKTNIQARVSSVCPSGQAIRVINQDGTVVCESTGGFSTLNVIPKGNGTGLTASRATDDGTIFTITSSPTRLAFDTTHYLDLEPKANHDVSLITSGGTIYLAAYASTNSTRISANGSIAVNSTGNSTFSGSGQLIVQNSGDGPYLNVTPSGGTRTATNTMVEATSAATFNTTSGALTSRGYNCSVTSTRSAGANNLTNQCYLANASSAQVNIAYQSNAGDNYFNATSGSTGVGYASGATLPAKLSVSGNADVTGNLSVGGSATLGDSNADTHTINGGVTHTDDGGAYQATSTPSARTTDLNGAWLHSLGGTYNTTSSALTSEAGRFSVTSTRSSGTNNLTNRALFATATGGQLNIALQTGDGNNYLNVNSGNTGVGYTQGASLPGKISISQGTLTTGAHVNDSAAGQTFTVSKNIDVVATGTNSVSTANTTHGMFVGSDTLQYANVFDTFTRTHAAYGADLTVAPTLSASCSSTCTEGGGGCCPAYDLRGFNVTVTAPAANSVTTYGGVITATGTPGTFTAKGLQITATQDTGASVGVEAIVNGTGANTGVALAGTTNTTGATSIAVSGAAVGAGTTNYGGKFSASNATTNIALQTDNGDVILNNLGGSTTVKGPATFGDLGGTSQTYSTAGTTNDLALSADTTVLIYNGGSAATWTGITGGRANRFLWIYNRSASNLTLSRENAGSSGANRIWTSGDTASLVVPRRTGVLLHYDATDARWFIDTQAVRAAQFDSDSYIQAAQGVYAYSSNASLNNGSVNFGYNTNGVYQGKINAVGYLDGTTQFRDLLIQDGKGATIATFTGSSKQVSFVGDTILGDANADTTTAWGHVVTQGTTPTLSSCGTGPTITGNDTAGIVVPKATSCTVTFSRSFSTAPVCVCSSDGGSAKLIPLCAATTTTLTLSNLDASGFEAYSYICVGK
jgi:hypothetical protein